MKILIIPLYLAISFLIPWERFSIHEGFSSSIFFDIGFILFISKYLDIGYSYKLKINRNDLTSLISTTFLAVGSLLIFKQLDIVNPFNYISLLFLNLVIIGPILEEFVFRGIFNKIIPSKIGKLKHLLSGLIFSFGHSFSIFYAPKEWMQFFYLQLLYTLILGIICSVTFESNKNITKAIILHIIFNLLFYVATVSKIV
ncbi:CPBP family intramembrane glutamic endopeptidase [Halobacteriovorax sp. HLS]|uniref:CPBP family intramembrane glutamic endopeptidase n=1 Tax=Halobacteriovorax sp. HLS TaxID=2234000 RepID=UPI000FDABDE0|nr:CPBP family intramembrane glutamic endopeptidase [Halobacteriovorax sp. HLS]